MANLIEIRRLPRADAKRLLAQVAELDSRIFIHKSEEVKERFYASMLDPTAGEKFVVLYEAYGVPVGFNLIKINPIEVGTRTIGRSDRSQASSPATPAATARSRTRSARCSA